MSEEELENQYDFQEERDNTMSVWGTWIAGFALFCQFIQIFDDGSGSGHHYGSGKQRIMQDIADALSAIPVWLVDTLLALGVTLVFANLKNWFQNIEKPSKITIPTAIIFFTSIAWIAVSVYEVTDSESAYNLWYYLDLIISVECIVLGILIATDESSFMSTMMIVYGVVNIGVTIWSNSFDEWNCPDIMIFVIVYGILFGLMAYMLIGIKNYLAPDEEDDDEETEEAGSDNNE